MRDVSGIAPLRRSPGALPETRRGQVAFEGGQRRVLEAIATGQPLRETLTEIARLVERQGNGFLVSILLLEGDRLRHGAAPSLPASYTDKIDGVRIGPTVGSCAAAAFLGTTVVVDDIATHPNWVPFRELASAHNLRACLGTPIKDREQNVVGTFGLYYRTPRQPTPTDLRLLQDATHLASVAIQHDRLLSIEADRRSMANQRTQLRAFFEHAPVAIAVLTGEDLVFELANPVYETMVNRFGLEGKRVQDVFPEPTMQPAIDVVRRVMKEGRPIYDPQFALAYDRAQDGVIAESYYSVRVQPYRGPSREVLGVVLVATEVTEQVRARQEADALAEQSRTQARLLSTLNHISQRLGSFIERDVIVQTLTTESTQVTGAAFGAFIYEEADEKGALHTCHALEGVSRAEFDTLVATLPAKERHRILHTDSKLGPDEPVLRKGRAPEARLGSYLVVPVTSRGGKTHGTIFLGHREKGYFTRFAEDLLVGIAAQAAISLDNAELYHVARSNEERFRTMAESLPQSVWFCEPDGHLTWANRRWCESTGQRPETYRGEGWLQAVHPDDQEATAKAWRVAIANGAPFEALFRVRRVDGEHRWHLGRAIPLCDEIGRVLRWFGTTTDIHEERSSREQVERLRAELAQSEKLGALGQLVSGVAHEIRTPLTYLTTNLNLIQFKLERMTTGLSGEQLDASRALTTQYLPSALEAVDRIDHLVEDLRAFTRQRGGARTLARVDRVTSEAIDLFQATHRGRVKVEFSPKTEVEASMDKLQVQQALLNLLQNAYEAHPRDLTIRVTVDEEAGFARVRVQDSGTGIPEAIRGHIFDPFFTSKSEGTGLGLSIVKRIADDHGGSVAFETSAQGTSFDFRIPAPRSG